MLSVYLIMGLPNGRVWNNVGIYHWINAAITNIETPLGTVMLAVLPIILGTNFLLQTIQIDMLFKEDK